MSRLTRTMRKVIGQDSSVEQRARGLRNMLRFRLGRPITRRDFYASPQGDGSRLGIMAVGGCDAGTAVGAGPMLARSRHRPVCVAWIGRAPETRSDLLVQTLNPPDPAVTREVSEMLGLDPDYFNPRLFASEFTPPNQGGIGRFPVEAVVLSISTDTSRTLYRHREHGFLVDPGGWWLAGEMGEVLADKTIVKWFAQNFEKIGRISLEDSMSNFERIVNEVRRGSGAYVVVMNVLSVDPGSAALDYKFSNSPNRVRRREFNIALAELADRLDFPVLDVDRIAKSTGIAGQADFVHYTPDQKRLITQDLIRILSAAGLVPERQRRPGSRDRGERSRPVERGAD